MMVSKVEEQHLPALHGSASAASQAAQATYLRLVRFDLGCLVLGAACTSMSFSNDSAARVLAVIGAALLVVSLVITAIIKSKNYERAWYGGRAIAESVKSTAWRYMTGAEPFMLALAPAATDALFVNRLQAMLDLSEQLSVDLRATDVAHGQITSPMRDVRAAALESRKTIYHDSRVIEQQKWYGDRAVENQESEEQFFGAMMVTQALAAIGAVALAVWPRLPLNIAGIAAAAAAALLAWLQVKRHQELAQSYAVAAQELGLIAAQIEHIGGEEAFGEYVADAESAISREHTLWVARRDAPGLARLWLRGGRGGGL